jgi:nucleotide-binding universal stress UspA family protein
MVNDQMVNGKWYMETNDDIRLIECANDKRTIQRFLNDCREERRPYVFVTNTMTRKPLRRLLVPVSMLEEETYKAEICTYLARKTGAHIILLQANDYGSHAKQNVNRIITHIKKVQERTGIPISYEVAQARKDSFGLIREASERQRDFQHDLLILTASRDYGLDDILFGPPERKAIQRSLVPVMLVNPREDLFSLCD